MSDFKELLNIIGEGCTEIINAVPDGWETLPLGVLTDVRSSNVDKKSYEGDTPVKLCNYTDVYYKNQITSKIKFMQATAKNREIERFTLELDDVIITKDSESPDDIAVPAYVSEELDGVVCGYHLTLLKPKKDIASGQFLSHLFQLHSTQHHFYILANGITRFGLTADAINNAPLTIPPLPEQQKIAAILSSVDEVIEKTQAQIDKLKDLKTGMMQELLINGIGHTEFKDSPVGRIPAEWEVHYLSDLMTLNYGKSPKEIINVSGKNPIWGTGGISNFTNNFLYDGDSILLGRKGTIDKPTFIHGKFWVIDTAYYSSNHGINIVQFLSYKLMMINLRALNEASGVPSLSRDTLYSIRIAIPPPAEQKKIVSIIESINTKISNVESKLLTLQNTKKALMQDLLTGKVRVKVDS